MPPPAVHVVLGVALRGGQVLVAWRHEQRHQGGCFEFPGGKVEQGESPEQALRREWMEEIGVAVKVGTPLIRFTHDYDDRRLLLDVREVSIENMSLMREGQGIEWRRIETLSPHEFPAANRAILNALKLPRTYAISSSARALERHFDQLLVSGVRLILFRAKEIEDQEYRRLAKHFVVRARAAGAQLLLHDRVADVEACGAAGVHLSQAAFMRIRERPLPREYWFAVSCHSGHEIHCAEETGADFCVLGPVKPTPDHAIAFGFDAFEEIVAKACIPVYALGGMHKQDLHEARVRGAQGIAGIRCFGLRPSRL